MLLSSDRIQKNGMRRQPWGGFQERLAKAHFDLDPLLVAVDQREVGEFSQVLGGGRGAFWR